MDNCKQDIKLHHSEKFGDIHYLIDKTDGVVQPYHIHFFGTLIDGEYRKEAKLEMVKALRAHLEPKLQRKKIVWQKEHDRIPVIPMWSPYDLR